MTVNELIRCLQNVRNKDVQIVIWDSEIGEWAEVESFQVDFKNKRVRLFIFNHDMWGL